MDGWAWFEAPTSELEPPDELCRSAAACLGTSQGRLLLRHLRQLFLDRRLTPAASDAELRHVEGQRSVVNHLLQLVERGRGDAGHSPQPFPDRGTQP